MIKIGVLGAGHLGRIHIDCIQQTNVFDLIGFYDPDPEVSAQVEEEYGIRKYDSPDELIEDAEAVDIVTTTSSHYELAERALKKARHVFIEKPVASSPAEARKMMSIASEANVQVQVGHVERFNPAFIAAKPFLDNPMFIETHRLAQFNPRGTDVSVVLDLMIHDIDIVLSIIPSNIKKIHASGVPVITENPDIANVRMEFGNGCVANLTASRISMKKMRKSRFFQKNAYISVDFLEKETEIIKLKDLKSPGDADPFAMVLELDKEKGAKQIIVEKPEVKEINAIKTELESFAASVSNNEAPVVSIEDGFRALEVAHDIMEKLDNL